MKTKILSLALIVFSITFTFAQNHNMLGCKDPSRVKTNFGIVRKISGNLITFEMNWEGKNGGSTFGPGNLKITNGTCETCKLLGAIGTNNPKQTWTIKVTDVTKPVEFAWKTPGTINLCGDGVLKIGAAAFK